MIVYRLKVTLQRIRPPIWRRLEVPAELSLFQLHRVVQEAMGWSDYHLHEFRRGDVAWGKSVPELGMYRENERRVLLGDVLDAPRQRMTYVYDFGDYWVHDIVLERILESDPSVRYPRVVAGARACPPEDVGGPPGYAHFVEVVTTPDHPEHHQILKWAGGQTDPETFDLDGTDSVVRRAVRLRRAGRLLSE